MPENKTNGTHVIDLYLVHIRQGFSNLLVTGPFLLTKTEDLEELL